MASPTTCRPGICWSPDSEERIKVAPFDLENAEVTGPARFLDDRVPGTGRRGHGLHRIRIRDTRLRQGGFERSLFLVDRDGREERVDVEPRGYRFPDVSPDGRTLAVTVDPRPPSIWIVDLARATASPLTREGYNLDVGAKEVVYRRASRRLRGVTFPMPL